MELFGFRVTASVEPKMVEKRSDDEPEILSSLESTQDSDFNAASFYLRQQRLFNYPTYTVTSTRIVYTGTTIKKPIFPPNEKKGPEVNEKSVKAVPDKMYSYTLPCLPSGFVTC